MDIFVKPSVPLVRYLKVLMISVYENNRDTIEEGEGITFWCLYNALNEGHKTEIKEIADMYGQKVEFIYGDVSIFDVLPSPAPWPQTIYFGLLAHQFLPKTVHRALYLDIDIAVNGSLKEFYNLPFDDNYLIASRDWYDVRLEPKEEFGQFTFERNVDEESLLANGIFNCGVLLFNLDKFRHDNIDINFYERKLFGKKVKLADQSILGYCFYNKTKLLKTCKYNYRIGYSMVSMRQNKTNFYYNKYLHYEFAHISANVIHYCGNIGFKPWFLRLKSSEIDANYDFCDITPEYAEYIEVWWKYAEKSPDYAQLQIEQQQNKTAYDIIKKLLKYRAAQFSNSMKIATLNVPDYADRNIFRKNEDIDKYVRPGIYACSAEVKNSIKNLPSDFNEIAGFRLTVKTLSAAPVEVAPLLQELEVASSKAVVYRRFNSKRDGVWGRWCKIDLNNENYRELKFIQDELVRQDNQIKQLYLINDNLNVQNQRLVEDNNKYSAELEKLNNALLVQKEDIECLKKEYIAVFNSASYKIGRVVTFIPRKIIGLFKKKK